MIHYEKWKNFEQTSGKKGEKRARGNSLWRREKLINFF